MEFSLSALKLESAFLGLESQVIILIMFARTLNDHLVIRTLAE